MWWMGKPNTKPEPEISVPGIEVKVVTPEGESVFGKHFFAIGNAGEEDFAIYRFMDGVLPGSLALTDCRVWNELSRSLAERMIKEEIHLLLSEPPV